MPETRGSRRIAQGDRITLHYTLSLATGKVVDTTREKGAAEITLGSDPLLPAFERCLIGLQAGDVRRFEIPCIDAFGPSDTDGVQTIPRGEFPGDLEPKEGLVVAFALPSGEEIPGTVVGIADEEVYVNFAHPLAGYDLIFDVEILRVQPA